MLASIELATHVYEADAQTAQTTNETITFNLKTQKIFELLRKPKYNNLFVIFATVQF